MSKYWLSLLICYHVGYADSIDLSSKTTQEKISATNILKYANSFIGRTYGLGEKNNKKIDCSGFVQEVFGHFNIILPRNVFLQSHIGEVVDFSTLREGDLLFFYRSNKSIPSHVAIYAGNGKIIHSSYIANCVHLDSVEKPFFKKHFLFAKRLFPAKEYVIASTMLAPVISNTQIQQQIQLQCKTDITKTPVHTFRNYQIFDGRDIELSKEGKRYLHEWVKLFKLNKYQFVKIDVYTDDLPPENLKARFETNQILSQARAESIMKFFISEGINSKFIEANGKGEINPIASNDTEEGRSKNRRVEFILE